MLAPSEQGMVQLGNGLKNAKVVRKQICDADVQKWRNDVSMILLCFLTISVAEVPDDSASGNHLFPIISCTYHWRTATVVWTSCSTCVSNSTLRHLVNGVQRSLGCLVLKRN